MTHSSSKSLAAFLYVRGLIPEHISLDQTVATGALVAESLTKLVEDLDQLPDSATEVEIQSVFYEAGKLHFADRLRWWFSVLYQVLVNQQEGPRLGQFTKIVGIHWVQTKVQDVQTDFWKAGHS